MMKASAMGAAGQGVPDEQTQVALSRALALQSRGADRWNVRWENTTGAQRRTLVTSISGESRSEKRDGTTHSYRLVVSCQAENKDGEIKIAWADPPAVEGQMISVNIDSAPAVQHRVDGGRAQGNGDNGPGATVLKIPLPMQNLAISNLFGGDRVIFPFNELSSESRRDLSECFPPKEITQH
jgi:hypothetical protein